VALTTVHVADKVVFSWFFWCELGGNCLSRSWYLFADAEFRDSDTVRYVAGGKL
jgi:hypothetical protein